MFHQKEHEVEGNGGTEVTNDIEMITRSRTIITNGKNKNNISNFANNNGSIKSNTYYNNDNNNIEIILIASKHALK